MEDFVRESLGFFAMAGGTLMDPIALPCYIAIGIFVKKFSHALATSIGFNLIFRAVATAIQRNLEGGAETGSPNIKIIAASLVGAVIVTSCVFLNALILSSDSRKQVKKESAKDKK